MRALDVMTSDVIAVKPDATVMQVAEIFVAHRISAVPVVDRNGMLVGIVSEGDLLRRAEIGTDRRRSWWLQFISSNRSLAAEYVKCHSHKVADVMTTEVITVDEATPIADIADLLETRHIKRVPVVRDGRPVGIVSRADLIRALAVLSGPGIDSKADDQAIRARLLAELKDQKWSAANPASVVVIDGVIHLWGYVLSEEERRALCVAAENIPGVKAVQDHTVEAATALPG